MDPKVVTRITFHNQTMQGCTNQHSSVALSFHQRNHSWYGKILDQTPGNSFNFNDYTNLYDVPFSLNTTVFF